MIGEWLAAAPTFLAAAVVVFVPGALLSALLHLRGLALLAFAPVVGVGVLAALAIIYGAVGVPWSIVSVLPGLVVIAALAAVIGRVLGRGATTTRRRPALPIVGGLVAGAVFGALRLVFYVEEPAAISQTNDAVFHMNALRWALEEGSASSLHLTGVIGADSFYPGAWHAIVTLTAFGDADRLALAANAVSLLITAAIWPLGVAWLTRVGTGSTPTAAIAAALSTSMLPFPFLMLQWGVLFPYALSISLVPAAVAATVTAARWMRAPGPVRPGAGAVVHGGLVVLVTIGALSLSQPAGLLVWGILVFCWLATSLAHGLLVPGHRLRSAGAVLALTAGLAAVWWVLARSTSGAHWGTFRGKGETILDTLGNAPVLLPPAFAISALMLVGLVVALRHRQLRWLAVAWGAFAVLYGISAAIGVPFLRDVVLGPWYADPYRLAALLPLAVIPLAAIGANAVLQLVTRHLLSVRRSAVLGVVLTAAGAAVALAVAPVVQMPRAGEGIVDDQSRYSDEGDSYLSADERALLERLDETIGADEVVIGNPGTGSGFGYLLSGRSVLPKTWSIPGNWAWTTIGERLRDAASDPEVCDALVAVGDPEYVLDFGPGEATPGRYIMPGMTGFAGRDGFELVDAEGAASLWRITACDDHVPSTPR